MNIQQDTDIATLVGEMEDVACEHSQHGAHKNHSDEPASHYILGQCSSCGRGGVVYPACPGFVNAVRNSKLNKCECGEIRPTPEFFTILGPVNA